MKDNTLLTFHVIIIIDSCSPGLWFSFYSDKPDYPP